MSGSEPGERRNPPESPVTPAAPMPPQQYLGQVAPPVRGGHAAPTASGPPAQPGMPGPGPGVPDQAAPYLQSRPVSAPGYPAQPGRPPQPGYPMPPGYTPTQPGQPPAPGQPGQPGRPGTLRPPTGYPGGVYPGAPPAAAQSPTGPPNAARTAAVQPPPARPAAMPAPGVPAPRPHSPGLPVPGMPVPTVPTTPGAAATAPPATAPSATAPPGTVAAPGTNAQPGVLAPAEAGARSAAVAQAAAAPQRLAAATPGAPPEPPGSPSGTVYSAPVTPSGKRRRGRWLGLLPRLAIGAHVANGPALRRLAPSTTSAGLVLGFDAENTAATVRLFQPEPTRMVLVGGLWAARVLVFRALALGATVTVLTARPEAWHGFGRWATGSDDRVRLAPLDAPFHETSSALAPALVVQDGNALGGTVRGVLGPWQAQLSVVPQLTAYAFPAIREAGLIAVQKLAPDEAIAATPLLRLNREASALVGALQDDMLALFDDGDPRYVWMQPTRIEREQFGPARRVDPPRPAR